MRKLLALVLTTYLLTFWMPLIVLAEEGDNPEGLTNAERCEEFGDNCTEAETNPDAVEDVAAETTTEASTEETTDAVVAGTDEELANAIQAPMMCPFEDTAAMTFEYGTKTAEQKKAAYEFGQSVAQVKMASSYSNSTCGEYNSYSHYYEKGDCSADGLVVTELTETIAPDTKLDDNNKIITTYAGICCFAGETKTIDGVKTVVTCADTRTIYTKTYAECTGTRSSPIAVNCEKRQWIIGDSGIGIVKLMVKQIFYFGAFAVGSVAVSTMVFQGIKISVSGVSGDISDAKNKILQALSGIVLLFLSGLILYIVNPGFFG